MLTWTDFNEYTGLEKTIPESVEITASIQQSASKLVYSTTHIQQILILNQVVVS